MLRLVALIAAAAATGCVADLQLGEPEVRSVCLDDARLELAAESPGEARADIDLGPLDLEAPEGHRVTLATATVIAADGVRDLRFAERVRVSLQDAPSGPIMLVDASVAGGATLQLDGDPDVDVGEHLRDGASQLRVAISGDAPAQRWTALVDLCFDLEPDGSAVQKP